MGSSPHLAVAGSWSRGADGDGERRGGGCGVPGSAPGEPSCSTPGATIETGARSESYERSDTVRRLGEQVADARELLC